MKERKVSTRWRFFGAMVAGAAIASCGPTGMEMLGDAMVDAGEMLLDGGDAMTPDAEAQACGMNCSTAGTQRVLTANTDPAQMRSGSLVSEADDPDPRVMGEFEGPFVLTGLYYPRGGGIIVRVQEDCSAPPTLESFSLNESDELSNVNISAPAGQRLCILAEGVIGQRYTVAWTGYHPYE